MLITFITCREWLNRNRGPVVLLIFVASIFIGSLRTLFDYDIWYQLLAGRYVLAHLSVPRTDFFLYAGGESPQIFGGWGYGLFYELVIRSAGFAGASLVNAAIWALIFALPIFSASVIQQRRLNDLDNSQVLVVIFVGVCAFLALDWRMGFRAECLVILFWQVLMFLISHDQRRGMSAFWYSMPIIVILESWLHTGAFFLLFTIPIAIAYNWRCGSRSPKYWLTVVSSCIVAVVGSLANPNGAGQSYLHLLGLIQEFAAALGHGSTGVPGSIPQSIIIEYLPIWAPESFNVARNLAFGFAGCVMTSLAILFSRRKNLGESVEAVLVLVFLVEAALHIRGIALAVCVAMPLAIRMAIRSNLRLQEKSPRLFTSLLALLCLAPAGTGALDSAHGFESARPRWTDCADEIKRTHPEGANLFVNERGPTLLYLLNDERYKIASSGHMLLPNSESRKHYVTVRDGMPGWEKELEKYQVDYAIVPAYVSYPGRGTYFAVAANLAIDPHWELAAAGKGCGFYRRLPKGETLSEEAFLRKQEGYFSFMAQFADQSRAGVPDLLGKKLGEEAVQRLQMLKEAGDSRGK